MNDMNDKLSEQLDLFRSEISNSSSVTREGFTYLTLKIDKFEAQIERKFDKIDGYGFWVKCLIYVWALCMIFNLFFRLVSGS